MLQYIWLYRVITSWHRTNKHILYESLAVVVDYLWLSLSAWTIFPSKMTYLHTWDHWGIIIYIFIMNMRLNIDKSLILDFPDMSRAQNNNNKKQINWRVHINDAIMILDNVLGKDITLLYSHVACLFKLLMLTGGPTRKSSAKNKVKRVSYHRETEEYSFWLVGLSFCPSVSPSCFLTLCANTLTC